jgi:hypothetical protein
MRCLDVWGNVPGDAHGLSFVQLGAVWFRWDP